MTWDLGKEVEFFEFFAPLEGMEHSGTHCYSLASWLEAMRRIEYPLNTVANIKPPNYWLHFQEHDPKGHGKAAMFNIWRNKYSRDKQLLTWASAPLEDFVAAGYARIRKGHEKATVYQIWKEANKDG